MKSVFLFLGAVICFASGSAQACGNLSQLVATTSQLAGHQVAADFNIDDPELIATIFLYSPKPAVPTCSQNVNYMNVRAVIQSKGWEVTPRNIFRAMQILNQ